MACPLPLTAMAGPAATQGAVSALREVPKVSALSSSVLPASAALLPLKLTPQPSMMGSGPNSSATWHQK